MFIKQTHYVSSFGTIVEPPTLEQVVSVMLNINSRGVIVSFNDGLDKITILTDEDNLSKLDVDAEMAEELAHVFGSSWVKARVAHCYENLENYIVCDMLED